MTETKTPPALTGQFLGRDAKAQPAAYISPCVVSRLKDPDEGQSDHCFLIAVCPVAENPAAYTLHVVEYGLTPGAHNRSGQPEVVTEIEGRFTAQQALTETYKLLGEQFDQIRKDEEHAVPQAYNQKPYFFSNDSEPLAQMRTKAVASDKKGMQGHFDRLSSQWGKKTSDFRGVPNQKPAYPLHFT